MLRHPITGLRTVSLRRIALWTISRCAITRLWTILGSVPVPRLLGTVTNRLHSRLHLGITSRRLSESQIRRARHIRTTLHRDHTLHHVLNRPARPCRPERRNTHLKRKIALRAFTKVRRSRYPRIMREQRILPMLVLLNTLIIRQSHPDQLLIILERPGLDPDFLRLNIVLGGRANLARYLFTLCKLWLIQAHPDLRFQRNKVLEETHTLAIPIFCLVMKREDS